jgi:hypothetical protein
MGGHMRQFIALILIFGCVAAAPNARADMAEEAKQRKVVEDRRAAVAQISKQFEQIKLRQRFSGVRSLDLANDGHLAAKSLIKARVGKIYTFLGTGGFAVFGEHSRVSAALDANSFGALMCATQDTHFEEIQAGTPVKVLDGRILDWLMMTTNRYHMEIAWYVQVVDKKIKKHDVTKVWIPDGAI